MATYIDPAKAIVDLLDDNWIIANTDSVKPVISKIFTQPKTDYDFNASRDYIVIFSPTGVTEEIGIGGDSTEDVFDTVTIDIRSKNRKRDSVALTSDAHFNKVLAEVDRILKINKTNFDSNYNELRSNQQWQDFNDRYRGIFRKLKTIELVDYCRDFS